MNINKKLTKIQNKSVLKENITKSQRGLEKHCFEGFEHTIRRIDRERILLRYINRTRVESRKTTVTYIFLESKHHTCF